MIQQAISSAMRWFVIAVVGLAVWRWFNGDLGAIIDALWAAIQAGADIATDLATSVMSTN